MLLLWQSFLSKHGLFLCFSACTWLGRNKLNPYYDIDCISICLQALTLYFVSSCSDTIAFTCTHDSYCCFSPLFSFCLEMLSSWNHFTKSIGKSKGITWFSFFLMPSIYFNVCINNASKCKIFALITWGRYILTVNISWISR